MGAARRWLSLVSCALLCLGAGCRGGPLEVTDADPGPEDGGDGAPADGDVDADADVDSDVDTDADADEAPPECQLDDSVDQELQCYFVRIDVARDVPGGGDRVRYHMPVSPPGGDYDPLCARMDEVVVTRSDGTVVRRGEARYDPETQGFVLEAPASDEELATCDGADRVAVFQIAFQGESPAGTFHGSCGCGCLSWTLSLACHRGVEASVDVEPWVGDEMYEDAAVLEGRSVVGNNGAEPLSGLTLTRTTWRALEGDPAEVELSPPTWAFSGFWVDWIEPGTWSWEEYLAWTSETELPPEALCPGSTSEIAAPLSHLVLSGSHSAGSFEIETHPFWCYSYNEAE